MQNENSFFLEQNNYVFSELNIALALCHKISDLHLSGKVIIFDADFYDIENEVVSVNVDKIVIPRITLNSFESIKVDSAYYSKFEVSEFIEEFKQNNTVIRSFITNGFHPWEYYYNHLDYISNVYSFGVWLADFLGYLDAEDSDELAALFYSGNIFDELIKKGANPYLAEAISSSIAVDRNKRFTSIQQIEKLLIKYINQVNQNAFLLDETSLNTDEKQLLFNCQQALLHQNKNSKILNYKTTSPVAFSINELDFPLQFTFSKQQFSEADYAKLNKLRQKSITYQREKGLDTLFVIIEQIKWNLPNESVIISPLILYPVQAVLDKHSHNIQLHSTEDELEINPVLRYFMHTNYGIYLPKSIAAHKESIKQFNAVLNKQISLKAALITDLGKWEVVEKQVIVEQFVHKNTAMIQLYDDLLKSNNKSAITDILNKENHYYPTCALNVIQDAVLPADNSQLQVLAAAHEGASLVIQGPPGTGKSQTIVNIIANAIAKGKKILVVAEKRIALEVVYERLKELDLNHFALLLHHMQTDKKYVLQAIQDAYEFFSEPLTRDMRLMKMLKNDAFESSLSILTEFEKAIRKPLDGISYLQTVQLALEEGVSDYSNILHGVELHNIPLLYQFVLHQNSCTKFTESCKESHFIWSKSILSHINYNSFLNQIKASTVLQDKKNYLAVLCAECKNVLSGFEDVKYLQLGEISQLLNYAKSIKYLITSNLHYLTDPEHPKTIKYDALLVDLKKKTKTLSNRTKKINVLKQPDILELDWALSAHEKDRQIFVNEHFELVDSNLNIESKLILDHYLKIEKAKQNIAELEDKLKRFYAIDKPLEFDEILVFSRDLKSRLALHQPTIFALANNKLNAILLKLLEHENTLSSLIQTTEFLFENAKQLTINDVVSKIKDIETVNDWDEAFKLLHYFNVLPSEIQWGLKQNNCSLVELKKLSIAKQLYRFNSRYDFIANYSFQNINTLFENVNQSYKELLQANANWCIDEVRRIFTKHLWLLQLPAAKLNDDEKQLKWRLKKGISHLKKEYNKKSHLSTLWQLYQDENSKTVLDSFNKVCLCTPSVAAELVSTGMHFDMVIFDEASQINIEDALPLMAISKQNIIVGDKQQLAPSNFFKSQSNSLNTSLLQFSNQYFESISLNWHYRSKSSELINFSNAFFYRNKLLVFPYYKVDSTSALDFEYVPNAIYNNGQNEIEAKQLALDALVLLENNISSLALIAFSEQQQICIEKNLIELAKNKGISQLVDSAILNQNNGLLISNLENVQGDERDVVLISVGYSKTKDGALNNKFGPILKQNGEKRLNVLFSRAREKMKVYCSFQPDELTANDNLGIYTLKQFLKYAKVSADNQLKEAQLILRTEFNGQFETNDELKLSDNISYFKNQYLNNQHLLKPKKEFLLKGYTLYQLLINGFETPLLFCFDIETSHTFNDWFMFEYLISKRGWKVFFINSQLLFSQQQEMKAEFENQLKKVIKEVELQY